MNILLFKGFDIYKSALKKVYIIKYYSKFIFMI